MPAAEDLQLDGAVASGAFTELAGRWAEEEAIILKW
jgi:hypothetical protein